MKKTVLMACLLMVGSLAWAEQEEVTTLLPGQSTVLCTEDSGKPRSGLAELNMILSKQSLDLRFPKLIGGREFIYRTVVNAPFTVSAASVTAKYMGTYQSEYLYCVTITKQAP